MNLHFFNVKKKMFVDSFNDWIVFFLDFDMLSRLKKKFKEKHYIKCLWP